MKVKITDIDPNDAYYEQRYAIIGETGIFNITKDWQNGFYGGVFLFDKYIEAIYGRSTYFHKIKIEVLNETKKNEKRRSL